MYIILVYDIELDKKGTKILRNVFKICKKYLHHIQKSVFEGDLTEVQLKEMEIELKEFIREDKDSVIVFWSRTEKWLHKEFWGLTDDLTSSII